MSLPRYPEYKESGVHWLGNVPAHWQMARYKQVFSERDERSPTGQETLLSVSAYTGVSPRTDIIEQGEYLSRAESLEGYKVCYPGDLVMNIMLAWNRGLGFSRHYGIVSPAYSVFRPAREYDVRFLDYLVRSDPTIHYFKAFSAGVIDSRLRLYPDVFGALFCVLPSPPEQRAIATFLDRETGKIDALIAEQERLIALLAEKRQATISHAVTRGLSTNCVLKDSGVPWLGEIPTHWSVTRLKYSTSVTVDCPHETPIYDDAGAYKVVRTADIAAGRLMMAGMLALSESEYLSRIRREPLNEGDVVYGREGERWGLAAQIPESGTFCLGQRMMQLRAADSTCAKFLMWQLNAASTYRQGEMDVVGATSPHVNVATIRNYALTAPPLQEQKEIATFLDAELVKLDCLNVEAGRAIALLKERRAALITAAVTGQIDVRGLVNASEPTAAEEALPA